MNFYVKIGLEFPGGVVIARPCPGKVYGSTHRCRVSKAVVCLNVHSRSGPTLRRSLSPSLSYDARSFVKKVLLIKISSNVMSTAY